MSPCTKYLDNLLINADGRICLVECKLWRNSGAVRIVVAQILDYAGELSRLTYEQLNSAVRSACHCNNTDVVADKVLGPDASDEDRADFHDAVTRSLKLGNFLLLIVGDGIRAGLQQIAELLKNRATLGFSLALIEMAIYGSDADADADADADGGPYYVQPRLLLQTEVITRTVFIAGREDEVAQIADVGAASKPQTLSEQDFFAALAKVDTTYPDGLRSFLERCQGVGVQPELLRTYVLRVELPEDRPNLGTISKTGAVEIWSWPLDKLDKKLGEPVGRQYMERVTALLAPDAFIKPVNDNSYICYQNRASIPLGVMLRHQDLWLAAMQEAVERFHTTESIRARD